MKLYCVRHGHAELSLNDVGDRALTPEGIQDVEKIAAHLAHRNVQISHLMHSSKQRAMDTAKILGSEILPNQNMELSELLEPDKLIEPLVDQIYSWNDDTMLVGHLPYIAKLVSQLVIGDDCYNLVRFTPGTVVCLERIDTQEWTIDWVLRPELLRT
jgi:phosphohistidine phosphatase